MPQTGEKPFTMADVLRHRRMCTGKRKRFATKLDGEMYLRRRKFNKHRVYACPYCEGFHFTKKPV